MTEKIIVGARKNPDGTMDHLRAEVLEPIKKKIRGAARDIIVPMLSEDESKRLLNALIGATEFRKKILISQIAKSKKTTPEMILKEIRFYKKQQILSKENGNIRHFHRTSIDSFMVIAGIGKLLSRSKLKQERPELKLPGWSSSDDVMMTRDKFDGFGNLIEPGFHDGEVIGASGSGIIFVFSYDIMKKEDYDATGTFPTISELSLQKYCETILIDDSEQLIAIKQKLAQENLNVPVMLRSEWKHRQRGLKIDI